MRRQWTPTINRRRIGSGTDLRTRLGRPSLASASPEDSENATDWKKRLRQPQTVARPKLRRRGTQQGTDAAASEKSTPAETHPLERASSGLDLAHSAGQISRMRRNAGLNRTSTENRLICCPAEVQSQPPGNLPFQPEQESK